MSYEKPTTIEILLPVFLLSFTLAVFLASQSWMLVVDRGSLHQAYAKQDETLQQIEKVKAQVSALAQGTMKLAKEGDKNAQAILDLLKKAGVDIQDQPPPGAAAPTPLAAKGPQVPPPPAKR